MHLQAAPTGFQLHGALERNFFGANFNASRSDVKVLFYGYEKSQFIYALCSHTLAVE